MLGRARALAGEVSSFFVLDDSKVREVLLELARLTTSGPWEEAIATAERLQVHLHSALRTQLDLGENEAASWSAEVESYQLALRLVKNSAQAPRTQGIACERSIASMAQSSRGGGDECY